MYIYVYIYLCINIYIYSYRLKDSIFSYSNLLLFCMLLMNCLFPEMLENLTLALGESPFCFLMSPRSTFFFFLQTVTFLGLSYTDKWHAVISHISLHRYTLTTVIFMAVLWGISGQHNSDHSRDWSTSVGFSVPLKHSAFESVHYVDHEAS